MTMIDRNPEGRSAPGGIETAVEDLTVRDILTDILREIRLLRLAQVRTGIARDLGDKEQLESEIPPGWVEGD